MGNLTPGAEDGPDWEAVYRQHGDAALDAGRWVLGPEPQAVEGVSAEDIRQEAFVGIMARGLPYVGKPEQLQSYLRRRGRWEALAVLKEAKRTDRTKKALREDPTAPTPEADAGANEEARRLERARSHFDCLTQGQRHVLIEYIEKRRASAEVAAELGVTPRRVRQLAVEAVTQLKRCLDEEEVGDDG